MYRGGDCKAGSGEVGGVHCKNEICTGRNRSVTLLSVVNQLFLLPIFHMSF